MNSAPKSLDIPSSKLWAFWLLSFAVFSAMIPRDVSFDVAHYQIYNGWAALTGRGGFDLAPAEMHSFLNPAWQAFVWILIDHLPGRLVAALLGALQGLILPALFVLTRRLLPKDIPWPIIMAIAVTGFLAEVQFGLFSSTRNDALGALGFIFALVCLLPKSGGTPTGKALVLASFILGALAGMKLTNAVYVAGFAAAVMTVMPSWKARARAGVICALAGLFGMIIFGGPHAYYLWVKFGNPVFPMMNDFFGAAMGPESNFRDTRYLPSGLIDGLLRPFKFTLDGSLINEYGFFDPRFLMTYISAPLLIGFSFFRGKAERPEFNGKIAVSIAILVSITAWTFMFSIERYMAAAWMLGPVLLAAIISVIWPRALSHDKALVPAIAAAVLICISTQIGQLRRTSWSGLGDGYIETALPANFTYEGSLVLFSGSLPTAFLAPAFPKSARLSHAAVQPWSAPALARYRPVITAAITAHDGPIYAVIVDVDTHLADTLARLKSDNHLGLAPHGCALIKTNFATEGVSWKLCAMTRL